MSPRHRGRWYPNLSGIVHEQVEQSVTRAFDNLYQLRSGLQSLQMEIQNLQVQTTPQTIRNELQATGSAPINITNLLGAGSLKTSIADGSILYAMDHEIQGSVGVSGQALTSGGSSAPGWQNVETTTGSIVTLDGTGTFSANRTVNAQWDFSQHTDFDSTVTIDGLLTVNNKIYGTGELEIDGNLNHDGSAIGFFGTAPSAQQTTFTNNHGATSSGINSMTSSDLSLGAGANGYASAAEAASVQTEFNLLRDDVQNCKSNLGHLKLILDAYGLT